MFVGMLYVGGWVYFWGSSSLRVGRARGLFARFRLGFWGTAECTSPSGAQRGRFAPEVKILLRFTFTIIVIPGQPKGR